MTVYVVVVEDRHVDVEFEVFTDQDAAVAYARKCAQEGADAVWHREVVEHNPDAVEGRLYYATYSVEDDSVWVVPKKLRGHADE